MGWYATDELEEAWSEAKTVLLPFDLGTWARLALIVLLTGQGFSFPNFPTSFGDTGSTGSGEFGSVYGTSQDAMTGAMPDFSMTGLATAASPGNAALALIVLAVLVIGLGFFYLSSVFEFIYYRSLLDKDVSIRENFWRYTGEGARYFGFRLGVFALMALVFLTAIAGFTANPIFGGLMLFAALLALLPVIIFLGLTQNFALLGMMENGTGLIQAWRDLYPQLKMQWRELLVYVIVRFAVQVALGVASVVWAVLSLLVLLIPFGIVTALFYLVTPWLAAIPVIAGLIVWLVAMLGLQVVFQTYLYNYSILVYHDFTA